MNINTLLYIICNKTMENNQRWKEIPTDILKLILKYDGSIVERNGIYMNQIPKHDERYEIIKKNTPKRIS